MKRAFFILTAAAFISFTLVVFQNTAITAGNKIAAAEAPVIIIDAGHGGEDGGAEGVDGTAEKDINLSIALKLNEIMSALGCKTRMIRTEDKAIHSDGLDTIRKRKISDIRNRTAVMNEYESCIYVSIHQNKYDSASVHGAQTFYSPNGEQSKNLADFIQKSIVANIQPDNRRAIKKSGTGIYVLYNADKPAVMVECGFLSNPEELLQLKDEAYQTKMAHSISYGIINYLISEVTNGSEI